MKIETFKKKVIPAVLAMSELEFAIYRSVKMLGKFSKKEYLMDMAHQMPNLKSDKAWRALENLGVKRTKGLYSLKMV